MYKMALKPKTLPDCARASEAIPKNGVHVSPPLRVPAADGQDLDAPAVVKPSQEAVGSGFLRQSLWFILIGILLYTGVYAFMEWHVYNYTVRNRFHAVRTAPLPHYDAVILGASRAVVFDYEDMNSRLEMLTDSNILNLSTLGGGITVNRLLLDYFLARHETNQVVYFLDSFVFYSPEWNEERIEDVSFYKRAPFDPVLLRLLIENPATREVALGYATGFYKINNPDWFALDLSEEETTRFDRTYRPVPQIDRQRINYLYPDEFNPQTFAHYMAEFETMLQELNAQNISVIIVKPPLLEHIYEMLPQEAAFDNTLQEIVQRYEGVELHDFSLVGYEREFFFNSDHLNRTGVLHFYENYLGKVLTPAQD